MPGDVDYFARWDAYDADAELDALAKDDKRESSENDFINRAKTEAQRRLEVGQKVVENSEVLDAHAAVAALRTKKSSRRDRNRNKNSVCVRATEQGASFRLPVIKIVKNTRAEALRTRAEVAKKRRERVETVLRLRDEAFALRQNARVDKGGYGRSLRDAIQKFDEAAKVVIQLVEEDLPDLSSESTVPSQFSNGGCGCCPDDDVNIEIKRNYTEVEEIARVIDSTGVECIMLAAQCHLDLNEYTESIQKLQDLLVMLQRRNRGNTLQAAAAWKIRAQAYAAMDSPLLAELNYSQATQIKDSEELKVLKKQISAVAVQNHSAMRKERMFEAEARFIASSQDIDKDNPWALALRAAKEAHLNNIEGFYMTAYIKYALSLRFAERVAPSEDVSHHIFDCLLSMGRCCVKRKMERRNAIRYITRAILYTSSCDAKILPEKIAEALKWRGLAHKGLGQYTLAVEDLVRASRLAKTKASRTAVVDELEKCRFLRRAAGEVGPRPTVCPSAFRLGDKGGGDVPWVPSSSVRKDVTKGIKSKTVHNRRPNIVLVVVSGQNSATFSLPSDTLRRSAVQFTSHFSDSLGYGPGFATLITGTCAEEHGVTQTGTTLFGAVPTKWSLDGSKIERTVDGFGALFADLGYEPRFFGAWPLGLRSDGLGPGYSSADGGVTFLGERPNDEGALTEAGNFVDWWRAQDGEVNRNGELLRPFAMIISLAEARSMYLERIRLCVRTRSKTCVEPRRHEASKAYDHLCEHIVRGYPGNAGAAGAAVARLVMNNWKEGSTTLTKTYRECYERTQAQVANFLVTHFPETDVESDNFVACITSDCGSSMSGLIGPYHSLDDDVLRIPLCFYSPALFGPASEAWTRRGKGTIERVVQFSYGDAVECATDMFENEWRRAVIVGSSDSGGYNVMYRCGATENDVPEDAIRKDQSECKTQKVGGHSRRTANAEALAAESEYGPLLTSSVDVLPTLLGFASAGRKKTAREFRGNNFSGLLSGTITARCFYENQRDIVILNADDVTSKCGDHFALAHALPRMKHLRASLSICPLSVPLASSLVLASIKTVVYSARGATSLRSLEASGLSLINADHVGSGASLDEYVGLKCSNLDIKFNEDTVSKLLGKLRQRVQPSILAGKLVANRQMQAVLRTDNTSAPWEFVLFGGILLLILLILFALLLLLAL